MKKLARLIGKTAIAVGKLKGKQSTALPGYLALRLDPNFGKHYAMPKTVIFVTGTNGKTTTTHMLTEIFRAAGKRVLTNDGGANMPQGIATAILKTSRGDQVEADVAVFETDELYIDEVAKLAKPDYIVVGNLFADQLDRFGSVQKLAEEMVKKIPAETTVIANGDDPMAVYIAKNAGKNARTYGVENMSPGTVRDEHCPACGKELVYTAQSYDHIGRFSCSCGLELPIDYKATIDAPFYEVAGERYEAPEKAIYVVYNALAATATALEMDIEPSVIREAIRTVLPVHGRKVRLNFNGEEGFLSLIKNPAGANVTLDLLRELEEPYQILFGMNNNVPDGLDTSWFQEIALETLADTPLRAVFITGGAAEAFFSVAEDKLPAIRTEMGSLEVMIEEMEKTHIPSYFLCNYTMLAPLTDALKRHSVGRITEKKYK